MTTEFRGGSRLAAPSPRWPLQASIAGTVFVSPIDPLVVVRPFDGPAEPWLSGHRGVDLATSAAQSVHAPGAGVVTFAGWVVDRGVLTIQHSNGLRSSAEPVVDQLPVGTSVAAGQVVARVDPAIAHCAPTSCLHWGVRDGEVYLDPMMLLGDPPRIVLLPDAA